MSRVVELNFESKNILTDEEARVFLLRLYNSSIHYIYKKHNEFADNEISYIVGYETAQSVDEIIRDIKFLCHTMMQNAIACKIVDDDITCNMMVSNGILDIRYKYFCDEYFTTADIAQYSKDCTLIYKREI